MTGAPTETDKKCFIKRNNSAPNILDAVEAVGSPDVSGMPAKRVFTRNYATLGCRGREKSWKEALSPRCNSSSSQHQCGRLRVLDQTPPAVAERKAHTLKHVRNQSGGYVNMALNDSLTDAGLDLDAAMESLQKLMICSRPSGPTDKKNGKGALLSHLFFRIT